MSKKIPDDLEGFSDLLDKNNFPVQTKAPKRNDRVDTGFALFSFLEMESQRLDKLINLFGEKAPLLKNSPQDLIIQIHQEAKNSIMRQEIIELLQNKSSPLNQHLAKIFHSHFRD